MSLCVYINACICVYMCSCVYVLLRMYACMHHVRMDVHALYTCTRTHEHLRMHRAVVFDPCLRVAVCGGLLTTVSRTGTRTTLTFGTGPHP